MLTHGLTSPPVMAFPDLTKSFVLHTDASQEGLRAWEPYCIKNRMAS